MLCVISLFPPSVHSSIYHAATFLFHPIDLASMLFSAAFCVRCMTFDARSSIEPSTEIYSADLQHNSLKCSQSALAK